jgi:hypothetical protein
MRCRRPHCRPAFPSFVSPFASSSKILKDSGRNNNLRQSFPETGDWLSLLRVAVWPDLVR